jgi:hypothetical protein
MIGLYPIPAPRRSARIAAREGRRLPATVAEELESAMWDLKQTNEADLLTLDSRGYLEFEGADFVIIHRQLKITLASRRVFNRFFTLWGVYCSMLEQICEEPLIYSGGPDGEYRCWYLKMIDEARDSLALFLRYQLNFTPAIPLGSWQ